jgi:hypothetical protein
VSNDQNEQTHFLRDWREGRLAHRPGVATVVMGVVLALTLLGAQALVWTRTPDVEKMAQARDRGSELILKVAKEGLDRYLGQKPIVRLFVMENKGRPAGFSGFFIQQKSENGAVQYAGRELLVQPQEQYQREVEFAVANDLSRYEYTFYHYFRNHRVRTKPLIFTDGKFYTIDQHGQTRQLKFEPVDEPRNMVPPMLLDFFTSLACRQEPDLPYAFRYIDISNPADTENFARMIDLRVTRYNKFPADVTALAPNGVGAKVVWYDIPSQSPVKNQLIFYDEDHQIVRQVDVDESILYKTVDEEQLKSIFPNAGEILNKWLGTWLNETTEIL